MIVFDLRCDAGHVFEAWFASTAGFQEQRDRGMVSCPMCGDHAVDKAVMAPRVSAKGNQAAEATPQQAKAMLRALATAQSKALEQSRWVGKQFASEARAMHDGEKSHEIIHGQATPAEAKALIDDGVPVAPLPLPVVPPEQAN